MEAGLDDPTLLQSYPLASLTELGLCESTTLSMGLTVLGIAVSVVPKDVSASSSVSCPSLRLPSPLSLPPTSTHKHVGNVLAQCERGVKFRSSGVADDD